jgi:hypothetical protein
VAVQGRMSISNQQHHNYHRELHPSQNHTSEAS